MQERVRSGRWRVVAGVFIGLVTSASVARAERGSLRLVVQPEHKWVLAGHTLNATIGLRDAHDQPSPATSAFAITLAVIPPVPGTTSTVTIPVGQSAATLQLQPSKPGILEIRATHPQAFDGGAFVRVALRAPSSTRVRLHAPSLAVIGTGSGRGAPALRAPASAPVESANHLRGRLQPLPAAPRAAPAPPSSTTSEGNPPSAPRLALRYSPQRRPLADGHDAVTIQAFLLGDDSEPAGSADGSFKVTLFASSGTLVPQPLLVQGLEGRSTLTADRPGEVVVEFIGSQPNTEVDESDRRLHIHFAAPIHGMRVEAKPASISLVDETDVVVTLLDANAHAVATDEPRAVLLALNTGRGQIVNKELMVKPGEFEARTQFVATGVGGVEISAASTSLLNQTAQLEVRLPLGLLAVSVMGGLVGGLIAFLRRRGTHWHRVAIGGVTGFLLYWAFIFGLMRVMPRAFVLNPLSGFALSTIGGWLGIQVFALLLKRLGLKKLRARDEPRGGPHEPKAGHARVG